MVGERLKVASALLKHSAPEKALRCEAVAEVEYLVDSLEIRRAQGEPRRAVGKVALRRRVASPSSPPPLQQPAQQQQRQRQVRRVEAMATTASTVIWYLGSHLVER